MNLDYLLRMQDKNKGDYTVYFDKARHLQLPVLKLGTWKLTKEGRESYKDLLNIEVEKENHTWGNQVFFKLESEQQAKNLCELLWLAHGLGSIKMYKKYIEVRK